MPHSRVSGRASKGSTDECILGVMMVMLPKKFEIEFWSYLLSQKGEEVGKKGPGGPGELFRWEAVGNAVSRQFGTCAFIQMQAHLVCNP